MSDTGEKLEVIGTIKEGVALGAKNTGPLLVNVLLWVLTIWIPYLNVGTTIGLWVGIIAKVSKGETVSSTEIFDPRYRKYMGEFFLTSGLVFIGITVGLALFVIPGLIICLAWSFANLIVIDKGKNPTEAITLSNNCTYGNKGRIFLIYFLVGLVLSILSSIFLLAGTIGVLLVLIVSIFMLFVLIGIQASIYGKLTARV